ncbi:MAG TPA: diguanylate cyclase [Burkholderiaceae bacterium]|nr:diguanylate cyclase [Burkholderiaceae bacterium]
MMDPYGNPLSTLSMLERRPRLLVVDDQPVNIQALYQVFAADYQVFMATNGPQALAICREKHPDLVLLDVVMPDMDGYEVCRQLKIDIETRSTPIIFVTAHHDEAVETRCLDAGGVDFISKPINPKVVRARVRTHIELKTQSDLLRRMAFVDGLTGVFNRRYFDEHLAVELRRCARNGSPLSLILIDVDFFKRYNDFYGHQAGDDCLRRVAATLKSNLRRPGDLVARYGGEEFACILADTPLENGVAVAQALEKKVRALGLEHAESDVERVVTISAGVAQWAAGDSIDAASLVALADIQLYVAKRSGRGCVRAAMLSTPTG